MAGAVAARAAGLWGRTKGCRTEALSAPRAGAAVASPGQQGRGEFSALTILFDGIAYGMLLFVLACGLAVTLGLMNFVNLAHGAFAMAGGYVCAVLVNRAGVPFALGL